MLNLKRYIYIYTYVHIIHLLPDNPLKQLNCKNAKIKCKLSFYNNKLMNEYFVDNNKKILSIRQYYNNKR